MAVLKENTLQKFSWRFVLFRTVSNFFFYIKSICWDSDWTVWTNTASFSFVLYTSTVCITPTLWKKEKKPFIWFVWHKIHLSMTFFHSLMYCYCSPTCWCEDWKSNWMCCFFWFFFLLKLISQVLLHMGTYVYPYVLVNRLYWGSPGKSENRFSDSSQIDYKRIFAVTEYCVYISHSSLWLQWEHVNRHLNESFLLSL